MDSYILLALKAVRLLAYGLTMMVLVPFLLELGRDESEVGLFMTLTLVGDVALSAWVTRIADGYGRRFILGASSILMLLSGVCFMFCTNYAILLIAAVVGVISPSGDEVGPFRAIEESSVAQITRGTTRSKLFAAQNLAAMLGLSVGSFLGGYLVDVFTEKSGKVMDAYRVVFFGYTMCALLSFVLTAGLSASVELPNPRLALENEARQAFDAEITTESAANNTTSDNASVAGNSVASSSVAGASVTSASVAGASVAGTSATEASQSVAGDSMGGESVNDNGVNTANASTTPTISTRISAVSIGTPLLSLLTLFGIDSLAYGFMSNSWLVEYLIRTFESGSTVLGIFFFVSTFISALTSFPSAYFTDAVGSVAAISFTKLGAGLFGALVPAASSLKGAMAMVWLRSLFDTMDVVPRQVFLTNIIPEYDRTRVLGLINIVKTFARAAGPVFTGILASKNHLGVCFVIMGVLEWVFAISVYRAYNGSDEYGDIQI